MKFDKKTNKMINKLTILISILTIGVPILIHCLFKIHQNINFFIAEWTAGELLNYYGTILGATATIIAVYWTIEYAKNSQKEERKLSVKPYLQSNSNPCFNKEKFESKNASDIYIFVNLSNGEVSSSKYYPTYIHFSDDIDFSDFKIPGGLEKFEKEKNKCEEFMNKHFCINYCLQNVGAGNAVHITSKLNDRKLTYPFSISNNNSINLKFLFNAESLKISEEYPIKLTFRFQDVVSLGDYEQEEEIILLREKDNTLNFCQTNIISKPKEIYKEYENF